MPLESRPVCVKLFHVFRADPIVNCFSIDYSSPHLKKLALKAFPPWIVNGIMSPADRPVLPSFVLFAPSVSFVAFVSLDHSEPRQPSGLAMCGTSYWCEHTNSGLLYSMLDRTSNEHTSLVVLSVIAICAYPLLYLAVTAMAT